ncbi:MAG: DUF1802 family protein [Verrucomicrobiota bacterium]
MVYGFKEWNIVCHALECGRQTVLLRSGGIHDPSQWQADFPAEFYLMPNEYHEQMDLVTWQLEKPLREEPRWTIRSQARVKSVTHCLCLEDLDTIRDQHILKPEVLQERFKRKTEGLWIIEVEVSVLPTPWKLADLPEYGGCRSIVPLPDHRSAGSKTFLADKS